ncbi:MAG: TaqI-like C-terminal specificity domain-containing protein, partial [Candidatus Hodarchaeales archaeon]
GFIIPSNITSNYRYQKIRHFLLENTKILKIIKLDFQIFPECHVETCIIVLQKTRQILERKSNIINFKTFNSFPKYNFPSQKRKIAKQADIASNLYQIFLPSPDETLKKILEKIEKDSILLSKFVFISRGIELGFHSSVTSDKKLKSDCVPLVAGRSIRRYKIIKNTRFIDFDFNNKSIFKDHSLYLVPKLLLRRIGHELVAAYDSQQLFCVCDVYMLTLKPNQSFSQLFYLEAILNSKLMSFYLKHRYTSVKQLFPKIPIKFLKDLPIRKPSEKTLRQIYNIVEKLHSIPWDISNTNSHKSELILNLEEKICMIYGISTKEKDIIESKYELSSF